MSVEQTIQTADSVVSTELAAFRKHVTALHLSFATYVVIIALAVGALVVHNVHSYERLLDKADARYELLQKDLKDTQAQYEADAKQRASNDKQVQVIVKEVAATNKKADEQIAAVTAPTTDPIKVLNDLAEAYYATNPEAFGDHVPIPDGNHLAFTLPQVQMFSATKIDDDRQKEIVNNEAQELVLSHANEALATKDLSTCQTSLSEAVNAEKAMSKAAHKGKWRKTADTLEKVGSFVAGIYLGRKF